MSEVVFSHCVDPSLGDSKNSTHPTANVLEGLNISIKEGWNLVPSSKTEGFPKEGQFLHKRYEMGEEAMQVDDPDAGEGVHKVAGLDKLPVI